MAIFNKDNKGADQSEAEMNTLIERLGTTLEAKLTERLAPVVEKVEGLTNKWNALEAEVTKPAPIDESTLTPEQKAERDKSTLLALSITTNARLTEAECIADIPEDWKHLTPKIKAAFASTGVEFKARADYREACDRIVTLFIGEEARKAGLRRNNNGEFFIEDSNGKGSSKGGPLSDPALAWHDERTGRVVPPEETLRKMGIDPAKFAEGLEN